MVVQLSWVRLSKMNGKIQLPQLLVDESAVAGSELKVAVTPPIYKKKPISNF